MTFLLTASPTVDSNRVWHSSYDDCQAHNRLLFESTKRFLERRAIFPKVLLFTLAWIEHGYKFEDEFPTKLISPFRVRRQIVNYAFHDPRSVSFARVYAA